MAGFSLDELKGDETQTAPSGFSLEELNPVEEEETSTVSPAISDLSTGSIRRRPPATDDYDAFPIGNRDDTAAKRLQIEQETGQEQPITGWELYNELVAQDEQGNYRDANVSDSPSGPVYKDPASGKVFTIPVPNSRNTSWIPFLGQAVDYLYEKVAPEAYANDPADVNMFRTIDNEIYDSGTNLAELGGAVLDSTVGTNTLDTIDQIPRQSTGDSVKDSLIGEGTALALSFFAGAGATKSAVDKTDDAARVILSPLTNTATFQKIGVPVLREVAPTTNRLLRFDPKKIIAAIGGDAGLAAGADTNTETIVFGAGSVVNDRLNPYSGKVLGVDPSDDQAEAVLAARTNILLDSLLASGVISGLANVGKSAVSFINEATFGPIVRSAIASEDTVGMAQVTAILDGLAAVEAKSSQETIEAARDRLVEVIRANKEVVLEMANRGDQTKDIGLDVLTALERGETISQATIAKAREYRKGIINNAKNDGATRQKMSEFGTGVEEFFDETADDVLTQGQTIDDSVNTIVDMGRGRVAQAQDQLSNLSQQQLEAETAVVSAMLDDPKLGPKLQELSGLRPSELTQASVNNREAIASAVVLNLADAVEQKNALYAAIPEGTPFDVEAFGELIAKITQEANAFDDTPKRILQDTLLSTINAAFNPTTVSRTEDAFGGLDGVVDSVSTGARTQEDIVTSILNSGADFKTLYNTIRPRISEMISNARGSQDQVEVVSRLREVRKFIDEQVGWVANNTDSPETAKAAQDAYDNYISFAETYKDEPFGRVVDTFEATAKGSYNPRQLKTASRNEVVNILEGDYPDNISALTRILDQEGSVLDREAVSEYTTAKIFESLYADVRNKGLEGVDVGQLESQIIRYSTNLREEFPMLATQLDSLADRVRTAQKRGLDVEQELAAAREQYEAMKSDAFAKMINPFVSKYSDDLATSSNATDKLIAALSGKDGADLATAIITNTKNNPVVVEGLQSAYLRALKQAVVSSKEDIAGSKVINAGALTKLLENNDRGLLATGRVVLNNDPKLAATVDEVLAVTEGIGKGRIAQTNPATSGTAEIQQYRAAVNRTIYMFVGALSRAGARARAGAQFAANKLGLETRGAVALDLLTSDPNEFVRLADKVKLYRDTVGLAGTESFRMKQELFDEMYQAAIRAGIYSETDEDREKVYYIWDRAIAVEQAVGELGAKVDSIIPLQQKKPSDRNPRVLPKLKQEATKLPHSHIVYIN